MTKHRSHSAAFKRQVAEEFTAGETLHALSKRHDISRQLIRIWVGKFEAGALDDDVQAADLIQEFEAKIAVRSRAPGDQPFVPELDLARSTFYDRSPVHLGLDELVARIGMICDGHCHTNRFYWSLLASPSVRDLTIPTP
jgi:transposase-like protein